MTAYLKPGDKVWLAFGMNSSSNPHEKKEAMEQAARDAQQFIEIFAGMGVTITNWSANSALTHPVVVAVFRDE